jgi:transposase-like protein
MDYKNHVFEREITEIVNGIKITKDKYGEKDFRYPRYIKEKVLDLIDKGMSHYEIGLFLNIHQNTIYRWQLHIREKDRNKYTPPKYKDDPKIKDILGMFKNKNHQEDEEKITNDESIVSKEDNNETDFKEGDTMINDEIKDLKVKFDECKASSPVGRPKYPDDLKVKVLELINNGHHVERLAIALNLYVNTVKRWLYDSKKPKRKRKYTRKIIKKDTKTKKVLEPVSVLPPREDKDVESRVKAKLPSGIIISASNASDLVKIIKKLQEE